MKNQLLFGYLYRKKPVALALILIDASLKLLFFFRSRRQVPHTVSKILIVKPDHLGDCLLSSSALRAISDAHPNAAIDYLAGPWGAPVLNEYSRIRKVWIIRHAQHNRGEKGLKKWLHFWSDLNQTLPEIRKENYDLIIFLRAFGGNFVFSGAFMNGKFLVGHGTGGGRPVLDRVASWKQDVHEVEHFAEVLRLVGIEKQIGQMQPYFERNCDHRSSLNLPTAYTAVHPGAGAESKKLSAAEWRQAIDRNTLPVVVCGAKDEIGWASRTLPPGSVAIDLAAKLSIRELFEVFDQADSMQGLDSFAAHLAACSQCRSVIVHFKPSSDPIQWRPLGPTVAIRSHPLQ